MLLNGRGPVKPIRDALGSALGGHRDPRAGPDPQPPRGARVVGPNRWAVPLPGLGAVEAEPRRTALIGAVSGLSDVEWAAVNAVLGELIIQFSQPAPSWQAIRAAVAHVEAEQAVPDADVSGPAVDGPAAIGPVFRAGAALAAEVGAAAVATSGRLLRWWRLPAEAAAVLSLVDYQPRLRHVVERGLGKARADDVLGLSTALAQGLAQGTVGVAVDAAARLARLTEARDRRRSWQTREATLLSSQAAAHASPVVAERPTPLPNGSVERYADRASLVAAAGMGVTAAATGSPRRAVNVALAGLPKASALGRVGFTTALGRLLARRGAVVMDPESLRRLDRITTVVIDRGALTTDRHVVSDVEPLTAAEGDPQVAEEALTLLVHGLFRAGDVLTVHEERGWRLGPLEHLELRGRRGVRHQRRLQKKGRRVLGLAHGSRLQALVGVVPELPHSHDALVAACARSNLQLVLAGWDETPPAAWQPDLIVRAGRPLVGAIRELQADGAGVLVVSNQPQALANADVGVGIDVAKGLPPWGAHILAGSDVSVAVLVIEAVETLQSVNRNSIRLAGAGSGLGALSALAGVSPRAGGRAAAMVNAAAAAALGYGTWTAAELGRRPVAPPISPVAWHSLPIDAVLREVDGRPDGLTAAEAQRRQASRPQTQLQQAGLARAFLEELANPLTPILVGGAALSAAVGSLLDAGLVLGVSALSALTGGWQRRSTDRAVADLLRQSAVTARVRRDGDLRAVGAEELVVGDLVELLPTDVVPADCRLMAVTNLEVDESSLTGESMPARKTTAAVVAADVADRRSMVFEGTTVAAGRATAVVVAVGPSTEAGRGLAVARPSAVASGVEARLAQITNVTLPMTLGAAGAVVGAGLIRRRPVRQTLSGAVGLAVAAVPEGLPFLVNAAQLAAARRLAQRGALVRNPRTIETLGRADVLCFDKTGTLTEGRIRLSVLSTGGYTCNLTRTSGTPLDAQTERAEQLRGVLAAALRATPPPSRGTKLLQLTDRAIAQAAADHGVSRDDSVGQWHQASALPFEPSRGYHATLARCGTQQQRLLSVKGAPEVLLGRCTSRRTSGGKLVALTNRDRSMLTRQLIRLAARGLRVLAAAERRTVPGAVLDDELVNDLTFLGFLGLSDPIRTASATSLDRLRNAGVQIVMITGDHPATAAAIARELDVLAQEGPGARGQVLTGPDIDEMDDRALDAALSELRVLARGTPAHKVRVVQAFQRQGRTVAMTGDGANDAPAIHLANVGIALGRHGTPAARAAADLVITDDQLETIIDALIEGRAMWGAVRDALSILVGGNLGEIAFTLFGAAIAGNSPLTARQLLLVNMLTDLAPALSIAVRTPDPNNAPQLLKEGPTASLGIALTRDIALRSATTATGASAAWTVGRLTGRPARARTIGLAALVGTQLGQTFLLGSTDPRVLVSSIASAGALVAVISTPGVSHFFGCTPLGPFAWATAISSATAATLANPLLAPLADRLITPERTAAAAEQARAVGNALRDALPANRRSRHDITLGPPPAGDFRMPAASSLMRFHDDKPSAPGEEDARS